MAAVLREGLRSARAEVCGRFGGAAVLMDDTAAGAVASGVDLGEVLAMSPLLFANIEEFGTEGATGEELEVRQRQQGEIVNAIHSCGAPVVFLLGGYLWDSWKCIRNVVKQLRSAHSPSSSLSMPHVIHITILCAVSEEIHTLLRTDFCPSASSPYAFCSRDLEQILDDHATLDDSAAVQQYGIEVDVREEPALALQSTMQGHLFLLPGCSECFPLSTSYIDLHTNTLCVPWEELDQPFRETMALAASGINAALALMGVPNGKRRYFALGPTSSHVAEQAAALLLANGDSPEREHGPSVSVVIVDRTLDLVGPVAHSDALLDRILDSCHPGPKGSNDVLIGMNQEEDGEDIDVPGSLLQPNSDGLMQTIVGLKQKESLIALRKAVIDAFMQEQLPINVASLMRGAVNTRQLQSFVRIFKDNSMCHKYPVVYQFLVAVLQGLEKSKALHWDQILSAEKVMQLNGFDDTADSHVKQLTDLLCHTIAGSEEFYSVQSMTQLAVFVYGLCTVGGAFPWDDEKEFDSAVVQALLSRPQEQYPNWLSPSLAHRLSLFCDGNHGCNEAEREEERQELESALQDEVEEFMALLRQLKSYRNGIHDYKRLLVQKGSGHGAPGQYRGLIRHLLTKILDKEKPELEDLKHVSNSLVGGLLRSGLGRFGLGTKPHPSDGSILVLFVLGGVAATEVRDVMDVAQSLGHNSKVVLGSTAFASSSHVLRHILGPLASP